MSLDVRAYRKAAGTADTYVTFSGQGGDFLRLTFKGVFLQLITLGFYRFWFLTNIRRSLWSNTSVDGDALEYTGRGRELLIGFLFALAILAPIYLVYFIIGLEIERWRAFAGAPLFLAFYLFGQFAIFRARRYRLTRTVWRGVRFWMKGSGVSYALRSAGWALLAILTLGAAYPWRSAALERYKMRNTFYGDLQGRFDGTGLGLFKAAGWIWGICVALILLPWIYFGARLGVFALQHPGDNAALGALAAGMKGWLILSGFSPFIAIILWPVFQAIEWRWWLNGLRLGELRFSSPFPRSRILLLYLALLAVALVVMIGAGFLGFAIGVAFPGVTHNAPGARNYVALALFGLLYLAAIAILGAFYRFFLQFKLWEAVMEDLRVLNLSAAANVAQRGEAASALGEGLADGLDVAGF